MPGSCNVQNISKLDKVVFQSYLYLPFKVAQWFIIIISGCPKDSLKSLIHKVAASVLTGAGKRGYFSHIGFPFC